MTIRVYTNKHTRTIRESLELFTWLLDKFGDPGERWAYGKEPDWTGQVFVSSCAEIEWFEFRDENDRVLAALRWGL